MVVKSAVTFGQTPSNRTSCTISSMHNRAATVQSILGALAENSATVHQWGS